MQQLLSKCLTDGHRGRQRRGWGTDRWVGWINSKETGRQVEIMTDGEKKK